MKSEDLLQSLDYVGEDLLEGSASPIRVREHRPWIGAAAAALALAVGAGGLFLWLGRSRRTAPNSNATVSATQMTDPTDPAETDPRETAPEETVPEDQQFSLRDCFFGYGDPAPEYRYYRDIDNEIVLSPWSDRDAERAQYLYDYPEDFRTAYPNDELLPVYQNAAMPFPDGSAWVYLSREYMEEQARGRIEGSGGTVERLTWGAEIAWQGEEPTNTVAHGTEEATYCDSLTAESDVGELTIYGNGDYTWRYEAPLEIPAPPDYELFHPFPSEPISDENRTAYLCAWAEALAGYGDEPPAVIPVHAVRYDSAGNSTEEYFLYNNEAYPHEGALSYSSRCIHMELDAQGRLLSYSVSSTALAQWLDGNDAPGHTLAAEGTTKKPRWDSSFYSWRKKTEADADFRNGLYLTTCGTDYFPDGVTDGAALLERAAHVEIVYRTDNAKLILPFYRYWVELDSSDLPEGLTRYGAFYVPAIAAQYLKGYPADLMPGLPFTAPAPTAESPDPTLLELRELFERDDRYFYGRILKAGAFTSPDLIPLGTLLGRGLPFKDNTLSIPEAAALRAALPDELKNMWDSGVEPVRIPRGELNRELESCLGLTLDQIQFNDLRSWVYLADRDCYYLFYDGGIPEGVGVESYETLPDGSIQLRYWLGTGLDRAEVWTANLVRTDSGCGYRVISNMPATWNEGTADILGPVDETTLDELKALFETPHDFEDSDSWYCRALTSEFSKPVEVNLYSLFYDGIPGVTEAPEPEEEEFIKAYWGWDEIHSGVTRLPAEEMDKVLRTYFGCTLTQTEGRGLEHFAYDESRNCYYHVHGDTNMIQVSVTKAEALADGTIRMEYENKSAGAIGEGASYAAILQRTDSGYRILSNRAE